jgi:Ca2+-transporting ATPase
MTLATLAAMALARDGLGLEGGALVTVSFLTLALAQIWHTFNMADPGQSPIVNDVPRNPYVWAAVLVCLALIGVACYVPPWPRCSSSRRLMRGPGPSCWRRACPPWSSEGLSR